METVAAARQVLRDWTRRVGSSGMTAMRCSPALTAEVDQHAAQIRDRVTERCGRLHVVTLAAYADGVADVVSARGWSERDIEFGWDQATWPSVHLLAVCVLAAALDGRPFV